MRFKKIALVLFACLALGAVAANVAQATEWTLGTKEDQKASEPGTRIAKEGVTCKKHGTTTPLLLTSSLLGETVELSAEQIDCLESKGSTKPAIINTVEDFKEGKLIETTAHSEGVLTFTGVKVLKPSTKCEVSGGELTTNQLTDEVIMDPTAGSAGVFDRFFTDPVEGKEVPFITIEFLGKECPLAGDSAPVKGSACGEAVHTLTAGTYSAIPTGTLFSDQTLTFGMAQQTTGTSTAKPCLLKLGNTEATLDGAVDNTLAGTVTPANLEKPFGAS
jgi:hypothetical protein